MTTERKLWWRKVVTVAIGGGVVAGGLVGVVRATTDTHAPAPPAVEDAGWTRPAAPVAPVVAEVDRRDVPPGGVIQVGATLPIPVPSAPSAVAPAAPVVPVIPAPPAPFPPNLEPVGAGPRVPDAGSGADKNLLPPVPSLPPVELPKVPAATAPPAAKPTIPAPPMDLLPQLPVPSAPPTAGLPAPTPSSLPALPMLPGGSAEAQKAPVVPAPPAPVVPVLLPPAGIAPLIPPVQTTESVQPMLPGKPDSGLNPTIPGNTLNPMSPTGPAMPAGFPPKSPGGRDVPGTPVDRPKPPEPSFGTTDKFSVPAGTPLSPTPRESAMLNLKQTAALAVLSGALLTAEQARSAALPPVVPTIPTTPVKADEKTEVQTLKTDLAAANEKIGKLEKQIKTLTELLTGKRDTDGTIIPSDPGAVEEIKALKDKISKLDNELKSLKTQTALKPAIVPEAKPKGIVKVVNEYPVEISMVINEKSHRILPNTKIDVEVPAGEFSYQLLQSGAAVTRSVIKDKETVTLRIK